VLARYEEAIEKFGPGQGSTIPVRLNEVESGCSLSSPSLEPLPSSSAKGAEETKGGENDEGPFSKWSYTTEIRDGSFQVVHQDYDNPYLKEPFIIHADSAPQIK
jgi:hypothetical protein